MSFLGNEKSRRSLSGFIFDPLWFILLSLRIFLSAARRRCAAVCSLVVFFEESAKPDLNFPFVAVLESF